MTRNRIIAFVLIALAGPVATGSPGWGQTGTTARSAAAPPATQPVPLPAPATAAVAAAAPTREPPADDKAAGFWDGGGAVLIGALPTLIWVVFAGWALKAFFPQVVVLLGRLKVFKGFGVELEFLEDRLEDAAAAHGMPISHGQRAALIARVDRSGGLLKRMRILWVDDVPSNNINEEAFLKRLGARIEWARTSAEAAASLSARDDYRLLIADMARPGDPDQGLGLLAAVRAVDRDIPIVIYCATDQQGRDRPAGLFGITNRPDELLQLVFDVRERQV